MKIVLYLRRLIGNNPKASIGVGLFILILIYLAIRPAKAAEVDLRAGSSIATGTGPVLGLSLYTPLGDHLDGYASAILWGSTEHNASNWSWQAGLRTCRGQLCASLGASYLQRIDYANDSHTNFNLELSWKLGWKKLPRLCGIDLVHLSDAGTTETNRGRNAILGCIKLQ